MRLAPRQGRARCGKREREIEKERRRGGGERNEQLVKTRYAGRGKDKIELKTGCAATAAFCRAASSSSSSPPSSWSSLLPVNIGLPVFSLPRTIRARHPLAPALLACCSRVNRDLLSARCKSNAMPAASRGTPHRFDSHTRVRRDERGWIEAEEEEEEEGRNNAARARPNYTCACVVDCGFTSRSRRDAEKEGVLGDLSRHAAIFHMAILRADELGGRGDEGMIYDRETALVGGRL